LTKERKRNIAIAPNADRHAKSSLESTMANGLLQTIAIQNLQIQQQLQFSLLDKCVEKDWPNKATPFMQRYGQFRDYPAYTSNIQHLQKETLSNRGELVSKTDNAQPRPQFLNSLMRPKPKAIHTKHRNRMRVAALAIIFVAVLSRKAREARTLLISELRTLQMNATRELALYFTNHPKYQIFSKMVGEISQDTDFLVREGISSLFYKPPKKQTQKFNFAFQSLVDMFQDVTLLSLNNVAEYVQVLSLSNNFPEQLFWVTEHRWIKSSKPENVAMLILYFCSIKCLIFKCIMVGEYSEIEEHNRRAVSMLLYKAARSVCNPSLPFDYGFSEAMQVLVPNGEENKLWNDQTCRLLFKTHLQLLTHCAESLARWTDLVIAHIQRLGAPALPAKTTKFVNPPAKTKTIDGQELLSGTLNDSLNSSTKITFADNVDGDSSVYTPSFSALNDQHRRSRASNAMKESENWTSRPSLAPTTMDFPSRKSSLAPTMDLPSRKSSFAPTTNVLPARNSSSSHQSGVEARTSLINDPNQGSASLTDPPSRPSIENDSDSRPLANQSSTSLSGNPK
jgi:hypothetical protein